MGPCGPLVKRTLETREAMRYHHGDLRESALREARAALRHDGLEGLSLRKLASRLGVSPPALYHHFRDKNDLLCAIAARGFAELEALVDSVSNTGDRREATARLRDFVRAYVRFATENPETYDLMFGRTIWKTGEPTPELREIAYRTFRRYAEHIAALLDGEGRRSTRSLRHAQVSWATIHGLCRLRIDGIYPDVANLDAMTDEATRWLARALVD